MAQVRPIHAEKINTVRAALIPGIVFETFNNLIAKNFSGSRARVRQNEVMTLLTAAGLSRQEIYDNHWLDIEDSYRQNGWKVTYDKPGYNESYNAYFEFIKK